MPHRSLSHRSYQQLKYKKKTIKILTPDQIAFANTQQLKYKKKTVKILTPDQIAFAAVIYFGHVFGFCRLINKGLLKCFLQIMCLNNAYFNKIYPFQQKPSHIAFDQEETIDRCHRKFTIKKFRKKMFTRKHVLTQVSNFIKKRLQHRCFPVNIGKFLKNLF